MNNSKIIYDHVESYSRIEKIIVANIRTEDIDFFNRLIKDIYNNASNDSSRCIVFPDDISSSKYYESELLILLEIIKNTKKSLSILTWKLSMFEQEGGLFYGDKRLVDAICNQMQEYKNIVLNIVSLDEPENGRNNKLLRELRGISDFEKRVHLYQYNNTNDSAKIDERFIISDFKDVKYIENNKQTSIFLANEKVAKYLLNKFHSLEKIPYRV